MRQSAKLMAPLLALLMVVGSMTSAGAQVLSDEELMASLEGLTVCEDSIEFPRQDSAGS